MALIDTQKFVTVTAKNLEAASIALTDALAEYPNARVTSLVEQTNTTTRFGVVAAGCRGARLTEASFAPLRVLSR